MIFIHMNCESCEAEHDGKYGSGRFCSAKCARGYSTKLKRDQISEKAANTLKGRPSPLKGKPGRKLTEEQKEKIHLGLKSWWLKRERISDEEKRARNVAGVIAYRARKRNAITPDADLELIKKIYEHCPKGYHVDHIRSLSTGGPHHQDNLQYLPISENCRKCADREYDKSLAIDWRDLLSKELVKKD